MRKIIFSLVLILLSANIVFAYPEIYINTDDFLHYSYELRLQSDIYPVPTNIPILRLYDIDKSHDIWHAKDPSSYIEPNNEWVKYYASQLYIDKTGRIRYKDIKEVGYIDKVPEYIEGKVVYYIDETLPYYINDEGNVIQYVDKPFVNNYIYDWEQFGTGSRGSLANDDYWANADYYLTHGMKGDCDEWMVVVTSMMLSGKMSVWQGDKLVKQIIPAKAVLGYVGGKTDGWVEYQVYNKSWITSTSREKIPMSETYQSSTIFIENNNEFRGFFEFNNIFFKKVNK